MLTNLTQPVVPSPDESATKPSATAPPPADVDHTVLDQLTDHAEDKDDR